jgi:hypothetical protein
MTTNKTRKFDGKVYTLAGEFDTKHKAENAADRIRYGGHTGNYLTKFRILKVESHAPPQGGIFYRLYYRKG